MAWSLKGTYFETCSCEVVCPCTASLALGADYDLDTLLKLIVGAIGPQ